MYEAKTELYMMMELMDCDLHRVIQSKQPLSEKHFKCFIKQILEAIKAMHSIGVFHRDLKPGNILVSKDCQVSQNCILTYLSYHIDMYTCVHAMHIYSHTQLLTVFMYT
ncbi:hypothetical protein EON65_25310 [archaeon]|nr:MAG: hypothetical protein EON65_25310 [archaeon]